MNATRGGTAIAGPTPLAGSAVGDATCDAAEETAQLERIRRGDRAAGEWVVRRFGGRLLAVARRLLGDENDARDALQDAFLCAFRALPSFEGNARLSTWLHRIVVNSALMKLRSRKRSPMAAESLDDLLPEFEDDGHRRGVGPAWSAPVEAMLEREETRQTVRRSIDRLPADYRTVLVLRDIEELDTDETASVLGITRGAVKTRLHRARMALRELLDPELAPRES